MLKAIWVDEEDERILSDGMEAYESLCTNHTCEDIWIPTEAEELLRIRALSNRITRGMNG